MKVKKPFLTEAMGLIDQKKYKEGQMKIYEGAQVYFGIIQQALNPFPTHDTALLIALYRHMANELGRNDPKAKEFAELLETTVPLQPIEFHQASKPNLKNKLSRRNHNDK